jgi:hypothetical protein
MSGRRASGKRNVTTAAAIQKQKQAPLPTQESCGLPCLIIRGLWIRRALLLREDEITPHARPHPCCRCPHARTLGHPVRVAAGYSASQQRQHLCAAFPVSLSLVCPRQQYAVLCLARRVWPASLPGPGMLSFVPSVGFVSRPPSLRCACIIFANFVGRPLSRAVGIGPVAVASLWTISESRRHCRPICWAVSNHSS